jgi:hypothetical protein
MKALKYTRMVGKPADFVSALNVLLFVNPKLGDLLDDGQPNQSF